MVDNSRIESREEVCAYIAKLRYVIKSGATMLIQYDRRVEKERPVQYSNRFTIADLFPNENPQQAIRRELLTLTENEYIRTIKDVKFPNRSEMREFGKTYSENKDVYIKIRVEILADIGEPPLFVMSFHYAMNPFEDEMFPYRK